MANILWIPHVAWRVPQRPKFFVPYLAKQHTIHVTNWDASFNSVTSLLSRRSLLNLVPRQWQDGPLSIHHVPRISPALPFPVVRHLNEVIYRRVIESLVTRYRIQALVGTFVTPPPVGETPSVLDLFDDNPAYWLEQNLVPEYADEIRRNEDLWARRSEHIVCVSSVLRERCIKERGYPESKLHVIPNGVDLDTYKPPTDRASVKESLGLDPNIRYVGVIGSVNKVREVARILAVGQRLRDYPSVRLLVVGHGVGIEQLRQQASRRNIDVDLAGFQIGERLLKFYQALDIGLCPYTITTGSNAICPMRLLHYTAVGSIVVSTDLEEVRRLTFPNVLISESDDEEAFAGTVISALKRNPGSPPAQIADYDARRIAENYHSLIMG